MVNLKVTSIFLIVLVSAVLINCASSIYRTSTPGPLGTDIIVSSDRIITECEFITDYDGDRKDPYGFMIHILDLQNTVLTVSNGIVLEKKHCLERQIAADKIIQNAYFVTVRGRGDAESQREVENFVYYFPKHGKFHGNGRSLNYLAIWNDKGQCYDAFYGSEKPCPRVE